LAEALDEVSATDGELRRRLDEPLTILRDALARHDPRLARRARVVGGRLDDLLDARSKVQGSLQQLWNAIVGEFAQKIGGAYCFANNLPMEEDRGPAEDAVLSGLGDHEGRVLHFSIVAAQNESVLQIQLKLKDQTELRVNVAGPTPDAIRNSVAAALVSL
jgi:hypothetical protein